MTTDWGWYKKVESWTFNRISINLHEQGKLDDIPFVMFEIIDGEHPSSLKMSSEWDDTVLNRVNTDGWFYCRDWTNDNIPWVESGEKYWSGFWFQHENDARVFHDTFGGAASWEMYYDQLVGKMRAERGGLSAYPGCHDHLYCAS